MVRGRKPPEASYAEIFTLNFFTPFPREIKFLKIGNISQKPKQGKVVHSKNTDKTIYILVDGLLLQKVAKLSCFRKVPLIIPLSVGSNNT